MALVLYNIFLAVYGLLLKAVSPFNGKAALFVKGRKGIFAQLEKAFENNKAPVAWFHAASLGEFEQGLPVIEAFKAQYPDHFIYISFFSPSGYELRKSHEVADFVSYLPLDGSSNARKLIDIVQPSVVVFIKYEFWYHYLNQVHERNIPLYCISALFMPKHIFFKAHGTLHRRMLHYFDHLFVQNETSKALLENININQVSISGDTRFDRVVNTLQKPEQYPILEEFKGNHDILIIGSSWPSDMELLYPIVNKTYPNLKFVIAPHEVNDGAIVKLEKGLTGKTARVTEASLEQVADAEILIINTIGMLSNIYQYGSFAYIGGAFGDGLHNILEAVTFGLPVIFGNKGLDKFPESTELAALGGAFPVTNTEELTSIFESLNEDLDFRAKASTQCREYIEANTGATKHILNHWKAHYEG